MNTADDTGAYESLAEVEGDEFASERWAFGSGFHDPLAGVDTSVPDDVDAHELAVRCLALGDDALVLSHRLAQWCSNAPELEDEVALANIALDLLGQARLLLTRAAHADSSVRPAAAPETVADEDALTYFRDERAFSNVRLVELDDDGDFGRCIARLLVATVWRLALLSRLVDDPDPVLAAVAAKAVPELTYHREYAAGWTMRLGDGTDVSHARLQAGLDWCWPYVDELFDGLDPDVLVEFEGVLTDVCGRATVDVPHAPGRAGVSGQAGRSGVHTEAMGFLLAELQSLARAHPDASW